MHTLPRDPEPLGDLSDRNSRGDFQDSAVTLLHNRQLDQCQPRPPDTPPSANDEDQESQLTAICKPCAGTVTSSISRDRTPRFRAVCENFLYVFKAAPPGRTRRRHGGHARRFAGAPRRTSPTPVAWRERLKFGRAAVRVKSTRATADLTRDPRGGSYRAEAGMPRGNPIADKRMSRRPLSNPPLCLRLACRMSASWRIRARRGLRRYSQGSIDSKNGVGSYLV
jgi:hypothetical protein